MEEKNEVRTIGIKATDRDMEYFKAAVEQGGFKNQAEALRAFINTWLASDVAEPDKAKAEIARMERHINGIRDYFVNLINTNTTEISQLETTSRQSKADYEARLAAAQDEIKTLKAKLLKAEEEIAEERERADEAEAQAEKAAKQQHTLELLNKLVSRLQAGSADIM
ncbi:MAG: hypothetical protein Q4D58_06955 [Synergistaceae bacterium]|nr:hypothetical protein [Synergistaceae bacterium]